MINYLANPVRFLKFSKVATPVFGGLALITMIWGLYLALIKSPPAIEHGQSVRMMYVHVPAAWSAMMAYTALTVASAVSFIWRHPLADSAAKSFAVPGTAFTFLALGHRQPLGKTSLGNVVAMGRPYDLGAHIVIYLYELSCPLADHPRT